MSDELVKRLERIASDLACDRAADAQEGARLAEPCETERATREAAALIAAQAAEIERLRERAEGFEALLLRIGELAHRYATSPDCNDVDRSSFCWELRRWCTAEELADFLRDRKELIASGALAPAEQPKPATVRDEPQRDWFVPGDYGTRCYEKAHAEWAAEQPKEGA